MSIVKEVAADVFLLTVPVPVIMKDVNIYIMRGEVPTLIDTGTKTPEVARATDEALAYLGIQVPAQALITHWHVDHAGGAVRLQEKGTELLVGRRDFREWRMFLEPESFLEIQSLICQEWGVPEKESYLLNSIYLGLNRFTQLPGQVNIIDHGATIKAGNLNLQVIESPGHSSGHLCFFDQASGLLFTGDQLLPEQIAYPGVWVENSKVVSGLLSYLNSLQQLEMLNANLYLPAHGQPAANPSERCRVVLEQLLKQSEKYVPGKNVFASAYDMSKERFSPDRLFFNLHLVAGWEEIARARNNA